MFNGFRIDVYGAKSSCTILISSMNIEKGKAQKNKNKAAKNEILSNIKNPRARFDNAGKIIKRSHSIIARHINYNFRNWTFLCFFFYLFLNM